MDVLITGGAGFIGSHLADELLARGDKVRVIDDLSTGSLSNIAHLSGAPDFELTVGNVANRRLVKPLIDGSDVTYHLAAAVGVRYVIQHPLESIRTNIWGTETVLSLAARKGSKVLIASTSEIYGKSDKVPYREDDERVLGPTTIARWSYSTTKAVDEYFALAYWRERQLPVVIARLFNTCGPRQTGRYGMVIPRFVRQALLGAPIEVYGDGEQTRCFAYVGDVVGALISLMAHPGAVGEVFNVGSDREVSINELARRVKEGTGSSSPIQHVPYERVFGEGFEDMRRRVPDLSKLKSLTGYSPRVDLGGILRSVVDEAEGELRAARAVAPVSAGVAK